MSITITKRQTNVHQGTEGPTHDPYGFTEYLMTTEYSNGVTVDIKVHYGLANYFSVNSAEVVLDDNQQEGVHQWAANHAAWITKSQDRKRSRCSCGSKRIAGRTGYPGEYLYICKDCGETVHCDFDFSSVV